MTFLRSLKCFFVVFFLIKTKPYVTGKTESKILWAVASAKETLPSLGLRC